MDIHIQEALNNQRDFMEVEVDAAAFRQNIALVRGGLAVDTKIILAAKSAVYGLGPELVTYAEEMIDGIAVESVQSALGHWHSGFKKDIYVLSPFLPRSGELLPQLNEAGNVIICLDSIPTAGHIVELCRREKFKIRAAVKVNCGLNRFGIIPRQLPGMMALLAHSPIAVDSIYTHFSGTTDSPIEKLREKENRFLELVEPYKNGNIKFHVADSACTVRKIGTDLGLVRIGLLPIGIDPVEVDHQPIPGLKLCFKVLSTILHITEVKKGAELGYRYVSPANKRVATIAGGYAHGLPRDAAFSGYALIKDTRCPYASRSFMEYSIIDISACDFPVSVGDGVEIMSDRCHPFQLAAAARNIPEIFFTSLARSIKRKLIL
jgi:alanine racemase